MSLSKSNALMGYQRFRDLPEHLKQESAVIELCLSLYSAETEMGLLRKLLARHGAECFKAADGDYTPLKSPVSIGPIEDFVSECCNSPVTVENGEDFGSEDDVVTCWNECTKCHKPCDAIRRPLEPRDGHEELFQPEL